MFTRKKKFFVLSAMLLFVSCLLLSGCGNEQRQQNTQPNANQTPATQNTNGINSGNAGTKSTSPNETTSSPNGSENNSNTTTPTDSSTVNTHLHSRAEKIADAVSQNIADVKDARVIITDKIAYVSVSIDNSANAATAKSLKEEVAKVVKKTDTAIDEVYVMEDADTFTRMKEMVADLAEGKPISGFMEELDNMFTRVIPSKE